MLITRASVSIVPPRNTVLAIKKFSEMAVGFVAQHSTEHRLGSVAITGMFIWRQAGIMASSCTINLLTDWSAVRASVYTVMLLIVNFDWSKSHLHLFCVSQSIPKISSLIASVTATLAETGSPWMQKFTIVSPNNGIEVPSAVYSERVVGLRSAFGKSRRLQTLTSHPVSNSALIERNALIGRVLNNLSM